jgi:uncharacterized protein (DUF2141 family)
MTLQRLQALSLAAFGLLAGAANATDLSIDVDGIETASGKVVVSVYKTSDSFLKKPLASVSTTAVKSRVSVVIANLEPGDYAAAAYQDENDNGQLDTNLLGIPKEPTGASNNAREKYGPPKFEQARFKLGATPQTISFGLRR